MKRKRTIESFRRHAGSFAILAFACSLMLFSIGDSSRRVSAWTDVDNSGRPSVPKSVSMSEEEMRVSDLFGNSCQARIPMTGKGQGARVALAPQNSTLGGDVQPIRAIEDPYPSFNGVAVDSANNLAMFSDTNRKSMLLYDRAGGDRSDQETKPLRQVVGPKTLLGYAAGLTFDANRREIYAVNNDIEDSLMVFSYDDAGNQRPKRALVIPHGSWGLSLSQSRNELTMSVQDGSNNAVVTYSREANGFDPPTRVLHGKNTMLADPHGVFVDDRDNELVVANWGSWNVTLGRYTTATRDPVELPGGSFREPSISVFEATAGGDAKPLRVIQGPDTQLAWPAGVDVDLVADEIVVANNADDSILFFHRRDSGNVKPFRVIKGSKTGINRPIGVAVDKSNNELWVANFGDHTALIFDLNAKGAAAPKRIIRNAPKGTPTAGFGNPETLAYDPKRDELLVPN
jgi:DNA-binding beta-propeller fold protein YncE